MCVGRGARWLQMHASISAAACIKVVLALLWNDAMHAACATAAIACKSSARLAESGASIQAQRYCSATSSVLYCKVPRMYCFSPRTSPPDTGQSIETNARFATDCQGAFCKDAELHLHMAVCTVR